MGNVQSFISSPGPMALLASLCNSKPGISEYYLLGVFIEFALYLLLFLGDDWMLHY